MVESRHVLALCYGRLVQQVEWANLPISSHILPEYYYSYLVF